MTLAPTLLLGMYRRMIRIRHFELTAADLFRRGQVKGSIHSSVGQEAFGVGVCMALRRDDLVAGTHRSHGHNLAKGAEPGRMLAEILGKETGYCKGRGGSCTLPPLIPAAWGRWRWWARGSLSRWGRRWAFR